MTLCYLALGSNLGSPQRQLRRAIEILRRSPRSTLLQVSQLYPSLAMGHREQPIFYNAVVSLNTSLNAFELLKYCQQIEHKFKRVRKKTWGTRTLDIDILLFGNLSIRQPQLTIPHPEMTSRDFVLIPLIEIAPHLKIPHSHEIIYWLKKCKQHIAGKPR